MSDRGMGYRHSPHMITMGDVQEEIVRAREKFPEGKVLLAALMEEVGELAQAMLQGKAFEEIRAEAKQVACVAIRIMEEGESTFPETRKAVHTTMIDGEAPYPPRRRFVSWTKPRVRKGKQSAPPLKLAKGED